MIIIIGAGITGVTIAKNLANCLILEKSKGVGGRLAARRLGGMAIEHGTQSFLNPKTNNLITKPHEWIKSESSSLEILKSWEVNFFDITENGIVIHSCTGEKFECDKIIITAPAPQAKAIIERSGIDGSFLEQVRYKPDIQMMISGKDVSLSNQLKEYFDLTTRSSIAGDKDIVLLTMKDKFLPQFIDLDKNMITDYFIKYVDQDIHEVYVHKWRYSKVENHADFKDQLRLSDKNIFLAGDYFSLNGINGAITSAEYIIDHFKSNGLE